MKYNRGDRVRLVHDTYDGTVKDAFMNFNGEVVYLIDLDEDEGNYFCAEDELKPLKEAIDYTYEIERKGNMLAVRFYEVKGEAKNELCSVYRHIVRDDAVGVARATTLAMKTIYERLKGEL